MNTDFYHIENEAKRSPFVIERILGINMIDGIGVGVAIVDPDGRFVTANQALLALLGYSKPEIQNMEINQLVDSKEQITQTGVFKKGGLLEKRERYQAEVRFIRKDGHTLWGRLTISRIVEEDFPEEYFIITVEDITIYKQTEARIKSQKYESLEILAGGIAHDFNNILAGILANVQLAKLSYQKGRDITKSLAGAEDAVKRAADLTQQLSAFSKGAPPIKKVTSIAEIIKDTVDFTLQGSKVKCEYSLSENLGLIEADPEQISEMIDNLIMNADQAMPQGGIIQVSAENILIKDGEVPSLKPGAYVEIIIRDTGVGISEANLGKIFDPYFTTKEKASGLGLTTSYSIVKRHDGYINVNSTAGIGTTVEIYLPVVLNQGTAEDQKEYTEVNGKGQLLFLKDEETLAM